MIKMIPDIFKLKFLVSGNNTAPQRYTTVTIPRNKLSFLDIVKRYGNMIDVTIATTKEYANSHLLLT